MLIFETVYIFYFASVPCPRNPESVINRLWLRADGFIADQPGNDAARRIHHVVFESLEIMMDNDYLNLCDSL